jgi:drug/metabolite transporter (DMT)-like permease
MLLASFMIFVLAEATGNHVPLTSIPANVWGAISYLAIVGSVATFIAFVYSVRHLPAAIASLYAYINPIVAMVVGAWLLHDVLTINLLVGSVITLTGVYIVNYSLRKR